MSEVRYVITEEVGTKIVKFHDSLTNHTPDESTVALIEAVRNKAKELGSYIIQACPESRETSIALTKLEESVMWAVKSLVLPREAR